MIPLFDKNGNLPPGIYMATVSEIEERFANNPRRLRLFRAFKGIVNVLAECNCKELYLNGSFVTNASLPNDYDLCFEPTGIKPTAKLKQILENLEAAKHNYLGDVFVRFPEPPFYFDHVTEWQKDRDGNAKGLIRVLIEANYDQE